MIIPQQETSGNYNIPLRVTHGVMIIPQQETPGNYNKCKPRIVREGIIPQQETSGNYNREAYLLLCGSIIPQYDTLENCNNRIFPVQIKLGQDLLSISLAHIWRTTLQKGLSPFSMILPDASANSPYCRLYGDACHKK